MNTSPSQHATQSSPALTLKAQCLTCRGAYDCDVDPIDGSVSLRGICRSCEETSASRQLRQRAAAIRRTRRKRPASGR